VDSDAEVAAARIGRVIGGRFRLERVLGIGGMAAVYAARDAAGQEVAVKLLHPEMAARREVRERFVREASVSDTIGHPGVVRTLPSGGGSDDAFLVMELLRGETLRTRVKRHGRLPLEEVLDYAEQILHVLVAAHDKGIVHRDLKPDNLFVTSEGQVKILDFGLARVLDGVPGEHRTRTGVALGTLAYMAPEQALGRRAEIDGRVDVFALGATMFRVLSGRRVHEAESEAELLMAMASRPAPPLAAVAPGAPEGVCAVVDLALAFTRDARYPDARTMLGDVQSLRGGGTPPYATARLASRDEATRAEGPAPVSMRTEPLPAVSPTAQRGGTMPLAAYVPGASGGPAPMSARPGSPGDTSPMSARPGATAPMSARGAVNKTEPLGQAAAAVPQWSAPPVAGAAKPGRRSRGLVIAVGALSLIAGVAGAVWLMAPKSGPDVASLPPPAAAPAPTSATSAPSVGAVAAPVPSPTAVPSATAQHSEPAAPVAQAAAAPQAKPRATSVAQKASPTEEKASPADTAPAATAEAAPPATVAPPLVLPPPPAIAPPAPPSPPAAAAPAPAPGAAEPAPTPGAPPKKFGRPKGRRGDE